MKYPANHAMAWAMLWACASAPGLASEQQIDIGQREYEANCIVCHGAGAKGSGPVAKYLTVPVPDLSVLSRNNGGVFPFARVYGVIDGRQQAKAHGTREMPIWGNAYKASASPDYDDYPYHVESFVRARLLALIDYLHRLQVK